MNLVAWIVVLNDVYYIDMCLESIIPYVDGIFILDEGCTDGTIDRAMEVIGNRVSCHVEHCPTYLERFDPRYNEPYYRTMAIKKAEEVFRPHWLLQIDADEIFTPYFFTQFKALTQAGKLNKYMSIRTATERFITPCYRSQAARALATIDGVRAYDPHTRVWRSGLGVEYAQNPSVEGFFHCVLRPDPQPTFFMPGICHIHLHRSFGPKAEPFWREGGDVFEDPIVLPFNPEKKAPKWFKVQMGEALYSPYPWPDLVRRKWSVWGEYRNYEWDSDIDWIKVFNAIDMYGYS